MKKIMKLCSFILVFSLLFANVVSAQDEQSDYAGKVEISLAFTQNGQAVDTGKLQAGQEFQMKITLHNTMDSTVVAIGHPHIQMKETVDGNPVKLCNISEKGNDFVEGSCINMKNQQNAVTHDLEGKATKEIWVDCKVPEGIEGKTIDLEVTYVSEGAEDKVFFGQTSQSMNVLGSTEPDPKPEPEPNPEEALPLNVKINPVTDITKLKKGSEIVIKVTVENPNDKDLSNLFYQTFILVEEDADNPVAFGKVDNTGEEYAYEESLKAGESVTYTVKGTVPESVKSEHPYIVAYAFTTDDMEAEEVIVSAEGGDEAEISYVKENVTPKPDEEKPAQPENPAKSEPTKTAKTNTVQTGDTADISLYIILAAVSVITLFAAGRRKQKEV